MRLKGLLLVALVLAVVVGQTGCSGAKANRALQAKLLKMARTPVPAENYVVEPPDEISIEVKGNPEYSRSMIVRPDGQITVPSVGDLYVQGKTLPEIDAAVTEGLGRELAAPNVTVSLIAARSKAIFVLGEVRRPGSQQYYGDMTLIDAVGAAGGVTLYAEAKKITLTRADLDGPVILRINLVKLINEGAAEQNVVVHKGDIIYVPPTGFAKVGYAMDQLFFPFRAAVGGAITYGQLEDVFDDDRR